MPFDYLGKMAKCPKCQKSGAENMAGYEYHCGQCGNTFRSRWNTATEHIEYEW